MTTTARQVNDYAKNSFKDATWNRFWDKIEASENEVYYDGLGTVKLIEQQGGEGQGDEYYIVFSVTDEEGETVIFKKEAEYSSYDNTDWDWGDAFEVAPHTQTLIVYVEV